MRVRHIQALAILGVLAGPGTTALAGPASERVFSRTALEQVMTGQELVYDHLRTGSAGSALKPLPDGEIRIKVQQGEENARSAAVSMGATGKLNPVSIFPVSSGNPLVPIFLESVLRAVSRATGGSTFYIRNRFKEALTDGGSITDQQTEIQSGTVPVQAISFFPFKDDQNKARMGAFAGLELHFVVSTEVPGDVVEFRASAAGDGGEPAYLESFKYRSIGEAQ